MVLNRAVLVLLTVLAAGCGESLFDDNIGGDDDGGGVPTACPKDRCISDAAAELDGSPTGGDGRWRYLGDQRDRSWRPMTPVGGALVGEATNRIERCPGRDACAGLDDALLVTAAGTSAETDPALEYTHPDAQTIQLALRVQIPGGGVDQRVRLYRNSREDVLFTGAASVATGIAQTVTADAVPGDRFLVALEPLGATGGAAAVQLFVLSTGKEFPETCRLAARFEPEDFDADNKIDDQCGGRLTLTDDGAPTTPIPTAGPFPEQGMALHFEPAIVAEDGEAIERTTLTVQMWVTLEAQNDGVYTAYSDINESIGTGLRIQLRRAGNGASFQLEAASVAATAPGLPPVYAVRSAPYPDDDWHFIRVVHGNGIVSLCIDGVRQARDQLLGGGTPAGLPAIGGNHSANFPDPFLGTVDDVRVFTAALPCD